MGRRGLVLTLLLGSALLPAGAAAQSGGDPCRPAGLPHSLCTGVEKLAERASAECRRPGLATDSQCASPVGLRVDRGAVGAFEGGFTHRALAFQSALADDLPLSNAPWVGTHNSYNSPSELPTISHTDSNQQLSTTDQLRMGVRSLEIDVHWFPSARGPGFAPVVCHARPGSEGHAGCSTERLLGEVLADIEAWLDANPNEVILLYLEDHLQSAPAYQTGAAAIDSTIGQRVYRPAPPAGGCQSLPLGVTRDDIRAAGKQVVIVGNCGAGPWAERVFDWAGTAAPHVESNSSSWSAPCGGFTRPTYEAKLVRYYEDRTWVGSTPAGGSLGPSSGITPQKAREMTLCGVDLTGLDQLLPGDGRLEAMVWSWAGGEPGTGDCAFQRADGRWISADCAGSRPAACRSTADGSWSVVGPAGPKNGAAAACASAGLVSAAPRTGRENDLLRIAASGAEPWLGVSGSGGSFAADDSR